MTTQEGNTVITGGYNTIIDTLPLALAVALVLGCMITDVYLRRIPNCLTLPAVAIGVCLALLGSGWKGFFLSILGVAVGFGLLFLPHFLGAMGAGDVKLMTALGALVGFPAIIQVFLYTAIAGGILALTTVLRKRAAKKTLVNTLTLLPNWRVGRLRGKESAAGAPESVGLIPYGVAIGLGTLAYACLGAVL